MTPRWDGTVDAFEKLGEPWATYGRLLIAEDDARAREQAAAIGSDLEAVEEAGRARLTAQRGLEAFRQHHTTWLLAVLRWAMEDNPKVVGDLFREVLRRP